MTTKSGLISEIENKTNLTKKDSESVLKAFVEVVQQQIKEQEKNDETR